MHLAATGIMPVYRYMVVCNINVNNFYFKSMSRLGMTGPAAESDTQ